MGSLFKSPRGEGAVTSTEKHRGVRGGRWVRKAVVVAMHPESVWGGPGSMTHSFRQITRSMKPIHRRRSPKLNSPHAIRPARALPKDLSSVLILRRLLLLIGVGILPIAAIAFWRRSKLNLVGVTLYASPHCSCCKSYVHYLGAHGFGVTVVPTIDPMEISRQYGMPEAMDSCHTALIGNYVVEGHVPADVIQHLLAERLDLIGISLPGMPTGTPGMDGVKKEPWTILAFGKNGVTTFAAL